MHETLALIVMLIALLVVTTCCAFAFACAAVYVPPDWGRKRDDLLRRVLVEEFGAGRGLELTDWRDRRIAALLTGERRPGPRDHEGDEDAVIRAVLRLSRAGEAAGEVDTVRWRARTLGRSALLQLEDWARSCRHVDQMLLLWRVASWLASARMWIAGVRRELVPAALHLGGRASSVAGTLGIAGVVIALFVYYGGRGTRHENAVTELLNLVGVWMAAGAVVGVLAVLGAQVHAVLRDLLDAWAVPTRRAWTALSLAMIMMIVAAGMQTFNWQELLARWQGDVISKGSEMLPERWKLIGGLVLFVTVIAAAGLQALRSSTRVGRPVSHRVLDAGGGLSLLIVVAAALAMVVAPRSPLVLWAGYGLVGLGVVAASVWSIAQMRNHRGRLRQLADRGITVPKGWYRWYLLLGSTVAPLVLWPLISALDAVPFDTLAAFVPRFVLSLVLAATYLLSAPFALAQVIAFARYVRRVRRRAEAELRPGEERSSPVTR